jgi:hypothetical protein
MQNRKKALASAHVLGALITGGSALMITGSASAAPMSSQNSTVAAPAAGWEPAHAAPAGVRINAFASDGVRINAVSPDGREWTVSPDNFVNFRASLGSRELPLSAGSNRIGGFRIAPADRDLTVSPGGARIQF